MKRESDRNCVNHARVHADLPFVGPPPVFLRFSVPNAIIFSVLSFVNNSYTYITRNETGQEQLIETK